MIRAFIIHIFSLLFFASLVLGDCYFRINGEAIIEKVFGFNRIFLTKRSTGISLYNGENIKAYCETAFRNDRDNLVDQIEINCNGGSSYYRVPGDQTWSQLYREIHCDRASWIELYESAHDLAKCEEHTSLAIGASALNTTSNIYAGICYNWNTQDIKYVNYLAYKTKNMIYSIAPAESALKINTVTMDIKIVAYQNNLEFMSQEQFKQAYEGLQEKYTLLRNFVFEYSNLMQDVPLEDIFTKYNDILSIIWWRNLRLMNWRIFLDLLEERSKTVKYNVIIGTSGEVDVPNAAHECHTNNTLAIVIKKNLRKVAPVNVWAYLKAISGNSTDDFVVIGYNTPFFTSNDPTNAMCEDICESIDWMRTFGKKRLMSIMGLIICCRPADVAHKLDNFPWTADIVAEETKGTDIKAWSYINTTPNTDSTE